jgi:hypothetical protein
MAFEWSCNVLVTSMWVTTAELHAALAGPGVAKEFEVCGPSLPLLKGGDFDGHRWPGLSALD